ncbi:MAG TPA: PHB depolymerase family esterase [Telluria sp.]|nr:PHB depolymerase family esterase [Telluria sp.]
MKPFENFLGQMMDAARLTQAKDPHAATEVIQDALRAAGLMPAETGTGIDGAAPGLVDLNEIPNWSKQARASAEPVPPVGLKARWTVPGRKARRAPAPDPRAPGEFVHRSFSAAAGARSYKLYVPSTAAQGPRPLIVMLHGCTQDPDDFAAGTAMNALAEQHGCLVLYPEQPRGANASGCWNWFEAPHQERDAGEPSLLAGMTREVMADWNADPSRVYVAGLSAGGAMAAIMGAAYPELYAAVGVHSGLPVGGARDLITGLAAMKKAPSAGSRSAGRVRKPVPVIVFHGDRDDVVHAGNGEAVLEQFLRPASQAGGASLRRVRERAQHKGGRGYTKTAVLDGAGRCVAEHWELHGAGHAWSGGSAAGSYTDPAGPDASAEMLRFFLER